MVHLLLDGSSIGSGTLREVDDDEWMVLNDLLGWVVLAIVVAGLLILAAQPT
jgi:hypothetical protein